MRPDDPDAVSVTPRRSSMWDRLASFFSSCLVVLLVLGLFYAVLFPVLSTSHHSATRPRCNTNVKILNMALRMYATDYDDHFPRASSWGDDVSPYVKNARWFECPGRPGAPGYAYNSVLSRRLLNTIADPAKTPTLFESVRRIGNAADPLGSFYTPHSGAGTVGYADGHVRGERSAPAADAGLRKAASPRLDPSK